MRPVLPPIALIILTLTVWIFPASAQALPPGFGEVNVVEGLNNIYAPVAVAYAPDGRAFVAEKDGRVRVVNPGSSRATTLIDLTAKVNSYSDRGMLGIAADKDFATNGYLYLLYVLELDPGNEDSDAPMVSRLTRVTVLPNNKLELPPGSSDPETVILGKDSSAPCPIPDNARDCITADFYWHTIGTVRSDPTDGTLWLGSGDSHPGDLNDLSWRPYNPNSFAGKIIHIDRNGKGLPNHPYCPEDTNLDHVCTKIYAMGFRNPFRFHLRPGKGPVVGDVGSGRKEEVDFIQPGRNYGWPCYEGTDRPGSRSWHDICKELYAKEGTPAGATPPNWEYAHPPGGGASVTVGPIYDGSTYPSHYRGDLFVGDYVQGWLKRLEIDENDQVTGVHDFATGLPPGVDLEMHPSGDLSDVRIGWDAETSPPSVTRYTYSGSTNSPPHAVAQSDPDSGSPPLTVHFTGSGSSDPDGDDLTFDWDFGDSSPHSGEADPTHEYEDEGTYTAQLTVTDEHGDSDSANVEITVTANQVPTATIESPADESLYRNGSPVTLTGSGSDPEDGELGGDSLRWRVLLHHNTHVHTLTASNGPVTTFTPVVDHDADSFYEIRLTATDSEDRSSSQTIELRPETSDLELASSPPGAPLAYVDRQEPAPFSQEAAVGYRAQITAAETFERGGRTYRFVSWSDGGARSHAISVPEGHPQLMATYRAEPACDNGKDDDGDGAADFPADLGCLSPTDDDENSALPAPVDATPATVPPRATVIPPATDPAPGFEGVRIRGGSVRVSRGVASIGLVCSPSAVGTCTGSLALAARPRAGSGRAARATVPVGAARFSIPSAKAGRVRVKISRSGRRLLARHGKLRASIKATATDGLSRKSVTTRSLMLKRPAPSRR
jgi:glucose/arabinose dehydrogenase